MRSIVSRLWRPELRVGLCADRLIAVRYARGFALRIEDKRVIALPLAAASAPWVNAVAALDALLAEPANGAARVTLVLSSRFVRYALLPWTKTLTNRMERLTYARHTFSTTYGPAASAWRITLCETGHERPWLACAVDDGVIEALSSLRKGRRADIASIEPYLMSAFNRRRYAFGAEPTWFVLDEPGHLTLGLIVKGTWRALRARRSGKPAADALLGLLERESALIGADPASDRVLMCSASAEHGLPARLGKYGVSDVTLTPSAPFGLRPYAMALGR